MEGDDPFAHIVELLACILGIDDQKRGLAQRQLAALRDKDPNKLVVTLLKILHSDSPAKDYIQYRKLAAVLIEKYVSTMNAPNEKSIWPGLAEETKGYAKQQLLQLLESETDQGMARALAHTISELDSALQDFDEDWPEIFQLIEKLIAPVPPKSEAGGVVIMRKDVGYLLLTEVFSHLADYYETRLSELLAAFHYTLENDPLAVKVSCIEALCNVFYSLESDQTDAFTELLAKINVVLDHCLKVRDELSLGKIVEALSLVVDNEPRLFREQFEGLFVVCVGIGISPARFGNEKLRQMALELLLGIFDRVPVQVLKGSRSAEAYFEDMFKAILYVMRQIPAEIDEAWARPAEVLSYDGNSGSAENGGLSDDDEDNVAFGRQAADRLLSCTKAEVGLSILGSILLQYFANGEDWRYRNAALMAASQVGAYIRHPKTLESLVPIMTSHITAIPNPKLKYAAVYCVTQISKDCDPAFHVMYHDKVMPALLSALDMHVPRLQQQTCSALRSFIDKIKREHMELYVQNLMEKLSKMLAPGPSVAIQESAMSVVGHVAAAAPETFKAHYYDQVMPFLLDILKNCKEPKYRVLKSNTIDCIVMIVKSAGKDKLGPYMKPLVEELYTIQEHELDPAGHLRSALLNAWQNLLLALREDLAPSLPTLLPSILKLVQTIPGISTGKAKPSSVDLAKLLEQPLLIGGESQQTQSSKSLSKSHPEAVDREEAISLASILVDVMGPQLGKYLEDCANIFMNAIQFSPQESLKRTAAISLRNALYSLKNMKGDPRYVPAAGRNYIQALIAGAMNETDPDNVETEANMMREILEICDGKCLEQKELVRFLEQTMKLLSDSNRRKIANNSVQESQTLDEQDLRILGEDNAKEDNLQIALAELLGAIFKTHRDESVVFVPVLYPDLIGEMLKPIASPTQRLFAVKLVVGIIEHLTYARIPAVYPSLAEIVIAHSNDAEPGVRRTCLYGVGAIVCTAGEYYAKVAENCYWALRQAIESPMSEKVNRKAWRVAQDNGVSSLGKLIMYQGKMYVELLPELISYWLKHMPIKVDTKETRVQCEILAELLVSDSVLTAGSRGENIEDILRILGEVLETDQVTGETAVKISKGLNQLGTIPAYYARMSQVDATLSLEHRTKLANNMKLFSQSVHAT